MSFRDALLRTNSKPIQSDIKKLTPQSMYHGTEEYFREKLGDRLPDEQYQFMELQTQLNKYNMEINENHINYLESIKEQAIYEFNRLMDEYKEKEEEGKDDLNEEPMKEGVIYLIAK
jgi:hypothetical protein